jgi:membrane protein required for colicin V production
MNPIDLGIGVTVAAFALRGLWRGCIREAFGVLALFGGLAVAMTFSAAAAVALESSIAQPVLREGSAFVGLFVLTNAVVNVLGFVLHRMAGAGATGWVNRIAGVIVGAGKGGALLAFVLLFVHLFPLAPTVDARMMESRLGPPLIQMASTVMQFGFDSAPQAESALGM